MSERAAGPLPALTVRLALPSDAAAVAAVHRESWRTTYTGILPAALIEQETGRKTEALWRARIRDAEPMEATWLALEGGRGVGFASCGPARRPMQGLEAEVYALYVLLSHQRRGVGRALMGACARHFVRHGVFGFYLWSLKANRARLFYQALGGEEIGEKHERLGLHAFAEVAYAWHELAPLVLDGRDAAGAIPGPLK